MSAPTTPEEDAWLVSLKDKSIPDGEGVNHRILALRYRDGWQLQPRCDWHEGRVGRVTCVRGEERDVAATCAECLHHQTAGTKLNG